MPTQNLSLEVLTRPEEVEALAPQWRELHRASGAKEPWLDPVWALTWLRHYGQNLELRFLLLRRDGRLVGLAPLCIATERVVAGLSHRRVQFIGTTGRDADGTFVQGLTPLALPGAEREVAQAMIAAIRRGDAGRWDECLFEMLDEADPWATILLDACSDAGLACERRQVSQAPFLPLPEDIDAYIASLRTSDRKYFGKAIRRFKEWAEESDARFHNALDAASLDEGFAALVELHEQRWKDKGGGAFSRPRFLAFHKDCTAKLLAEGMLDLRWITTAGKPVAACYVVKSAGRRHLYQFGRDTDVPPQVRIGINILLEALRVAIAEGAHEFDFMSGMHDYKLRLTPHHRNLVSIHSYRNPLRMAARRTLRAARGAIARGAEAADSP